MAQMKPWGEPRSKTITWRDPAVTAAAAATMSGLELLRAVADGTLPPAPISRHFDFHPISVEEGDVVFSCEPDESAYNPIGTVHGGFVCTLLDTVTGCAVHTTLPAGTAYTSIEIKVSYLRPVHHDTGPLTAHGWVTKPADVPPSLRATYATLTARCWPQRPAPAWS